MSHSDGYFSAPRSRLEPPPPSKKLTDEELKASTERLSQRHKRHNELPPLVEKRVLTQETQAKSLDRLYTNSLEQKKRMVETLEKQQHPDMVKHVELDGDALQAMSERLYRQSMVKKEESVKKLQAKYLASTGKGAGEAKVLTAEEVAASAKRLCNESIDAQRESNNKLYEKYVDSTAPKFAKLTPEQIKASADRLCSKKAA